MRLPLLPTLMVAVMVPVMIGLGFWQLHRADWKADLLVRLEAQAKLPVLETSGLSDDDLEFRRVRVTATCPDPAPKVRSGKRANGQVGFSALLSCGVEAQPLLIDIGWSDRPDGWTKIEQGPPHGALIVTGTLVRTSGEGPRYTLVSEAAAAPLLPSAPPSPEDIPNNHMAYAVQWFAFAATLGIIYAVYVSRLRRGK